MARRLLMILSACALLVAGCGDDDDEGSQEAFCDRFRTQPTLSVGVFDEAAVSETLTFFAGLEEAAPAEIQGEVTSVVDQLEELLEAMAEYEGLEGQEAIDAIQETGDVDLDALTQSATAVGEYAAENCEDVDPVEG